MTKRLIWSFERPAAYAGTCADRASLNLRAWPSEPETGSSQARAKRSLRSRKLLNSFLGVSRERRIVKENKNNDENYNDEQVQNLGRPNPEP